MFAILSYCAPRILLFPVWSQWALERVKIGILMFVMHNIASIVFANILEHY